LAHSRAGVETVEPMPENRGSLPKDPRQFVLLPAIARVRYAGLLEKQGSFRECAEKAPFNQFFDGKDKSLGIICCGITYNYLKENYPDECPYPHVKLSQYPLPEDMLKKMEEQVDEILVLEEGYPLVEEMLSGFFCRGRRILGRLDGTLPRMGELNPDHVAKALGIPVKEGGKAPDMLANRPPALCKGCSHHDTYKALNLVMEPFGDGHVFSDIGCYTLGALPPYSSINSCVDMGASITMAKGAADAGLFPSVAVIGDSTFTHSGMTGLLDAVNEKTPITVLICDNESVSMTGGQDSAALGKIESICLGLGVDPDHLHTIEAHRKNHDKLVELLEKEVNYEGVSVIIPRRECIQKAARRIRAEKMKREQNA
jgi:indolepyruvate ferredoxin oxidoreductase alpha subunit